MSKSTYLNTVTVPNSGTDVISDGSTVGGDIVKNFKALASICHRSSSGVGVIVGVEPSASASQTASAVVGGFGNQADAPYSVAIGGKNCTVGTIGAMATNTDMDNQLVGGYSFVKSVTVPGGSGTSEAGILAMIPSGGAAVLNLQFIAASSGTIQTCTMMIQPGDSGYVYPDYWDSNYIAGDFYLNNNNLYFQNYHSSPVQVGIFGTIIGQTSVGSDGNDGS